MPRTQLVNREGSGQQWTADVIHDGQFAARLSVSNPLTHKRAITHLEPITYREGYIERSGAWEPATEPAEIEAVQGIGWEIVESVTGWGSYTHIIVTTGDIPGAHYLAEIRSGRA